MTGAMLRTRCSEITIISGLASDKIRAKIVKEGHGVTLNQSYGDSQSLKSPCSNT